MTSLLTTFANKILSHFSPEPAPNSSGRNKRSNANAWLGNEEPREGLDGGAAAGVRRATTAGTYSDVAEGAGAAAVASRPPKAARYEVGGLSSSLSLASSTAAGARSREGHSRDQSTARSPPQPTAARRTPLAASRPTTGLGVPSQASATGRSPRPRSDGGGGGGEGGGVGALRAVAGGLSATPRTPLGRWSGAEAAAGSGVGTRRDGGGGGVGEVNVGMLPGYTYGMPVLPQSTPRRLIMANAHSARTRTTDNGGGGGGGGGNTGRKPYGGLGYWRQSFSRRGSASGVGGGSRASNVNLGGSTSSAFTNRSSSSRAMRGPGNDGVDDGGAYPSLGGGDTGGVGGSGGGGRGYTGFVFKSKAARQKKVAAALAEMRREAKSRAVSSAGGGSAVVAWTSYDSESPSRQAFSVRSLNSLRSKARHSLEKTARGIHHRNPLAAERLLADARSIENWGREAEEGAKREAAEKARQRSEALVARLAEQAKARKAAATAKKKAAAEALARAEEEAARARKRAEEDEAARVRAQLEEREQEEARLAAAATAAAAAAAAVQERPELSPEQENQVRDAWSSQGGAADGDIVVRAFNDMVSKASLRTLRSGEWLGDEVINLYMKSLQARNREAVASGKQVPKCGIMSSFFYTQLSDNGRGYRYQGVKRFLKKAKIDLFDLDKFIFPINVNQNHWTLAVINFRLERLEYYDSLGAPFGDAGFEYMVRFVDDESRNKRGGQEMDISHWPRFNYQNVPHQRNGIDCGVFASMFADRLSKGRPLSFSQSDIRHCRKVLTLAILRGERSPTEKEAFLEDGRSVPGDAGEWWEPPQDEQADGDGSKNAEDEEVGVDDEEEWGSEEGQEEEESEQGGWRDDDGLLPQGGGSEGGEGVDKASSDAEGRGVWGQETANGFDLTASDAGEEENANGLFDLISDGMQEEGEEQEEEEAGVVHGRGGQAEEYEMNVEDGMDVEDTGVAVGVSDEVWGRGAPAAAAAASKEGDNIGGRKTSWPALVPPQQHQ